MAGNSKPEPEELLSGRRGVTGLRDDVWLLDTSPIVAKEAGAELYDEVAGPADIVIASTEFAANRDGVLVGMIS